MERSRDVKGARAGEAYAQRSCVGLALVAFEEPSDRFTDSRHDRVDDDEADQEGDQGKFVGCGKTEHRDPVHSLPSRASCGAIVVYCLLTAARTMTERAGRTR